MVKGKIMKQSIMEGFISALRGYRNGIMTGVRIRIPYVIQSIIYAVIYRNEIHFNKVRFVMKQMIQHGRNLGVYVGIYKLICNILRNCGIDGGIDSWIAGLIGGAIAFGDSKGLSGAVNNQIVLYLFARGIEGTLRSFVKRGYLPPQMDVRSETGFRLLAAFSLALILYLTEYEPDMLRSGFMSTMDELYYESNSGPIRPPRSFTIIVALVTVSLLLGAFFPSLRIENLFKRFDYYFSWNNALNLLNSLMFWKKDNLSSNSPISPSISITTTTPPTTTTN